MGVSSSGCATIAHENAGSCGEDMTQQQLAQHFYDMAKKEGYYINRSVRMDPRHCDACTVHDGRQSTNMRAVFVRNMRQVDLCQECAQMIGLIW